MGYFKAKQAFFRFSMDVPEEDITFVMQRYFPDMTVALQPLQMTEYYLQRNVIAEFFGYRLWLESDVATLLDKSTELARQDVSPTFILTELIVFLKNRKEDTLSELAAIKQDAKNFSYQMMVVERQKRATLEPAYPR